MDLKEYDALLAADQLSTAIGVATESNSDHLILLRSSITAESHPHRPEDPKHNWTTELFWVSGLGSLSTPWKSRSENVTSAGA